MMVPNPPVPIQQSPVKSCFQLTPAARPLWPGIIFCPSERLDSQCNWERDRRQYQRGCLVSHYYQRWHGCSGWNSFSVGSGFDLNLNSTSITSGQTVSISALTITSRRPDGIHCSR